MSGNNNFRGRGSYRGHKRFRGNGGGAYSKNNHGSYGGSNSHENAHRSDGCGGNEEFPKFRDKQQQQIQNQRQHQRGRRQSTYSANWTRWSGDGVGGGNDWNYNHGNKMEEHIPTTMTGENNSRHDGGTVKPWNRSRSKLNNEGTAANSTSTATMPGENETRLGNEPGGETSDWNHSRANENGIKNSTMLTGDVGGVGNISATTTIIPQVPAQIVVQNQSSSIEDKKPLLSKIKIEKSELKIKPIPPPPSQTKSSSSSSESSSSDDDNDEKDDADAAETRKTKQTPSPSIENKQKPTVKETTNSKKDKKHKKVPIEPTPSSSSSSEDSSSESDEESSPRSKKTIREPIKPPAMASEKNKSEKKKSKAKPPVDEDLICLGKLDNKYVIEDDDADAMGEEHQNPARLKREQCLLCDKKGHTAFQCQMICKNCSAAYHNHKSCPKPANLTIMLQHFMEFCMQQMQHFNPDQKFVCPLNVNSQASGPPMSNKTGTPSKQKRAHNKSKPKLKAPAKRKRNQVSDSEDDNDDDDGEVEATDSTANASADSSDATSSESEYSVGTSSSAKKKKAKIFTHSNDAVAFNSLYGSSAAGITPFSALPAAALAAYNPMLFNQMLQSGFPGALNFKK